MAQRAVLAGTPVVYRWINPQKDTNTCEIRVYNSYTGKSGL